jgi:hypothetical protein
MAIVAGGISPSLKMFGGKEPFIACFAPPCSVIDLVFRLPIASVSRHLFEPALPPFRPDQTAINPAFYGDEKLIDNLNQPVYSSIKILSLWYF